MANLATVQVPKDFAYVGLVAAVSPLLLAWQISIVSANRRKSGIKYPQLYATPEQEKADKAAHLFNCAQRVHGNTMEHYPIFLLSLITSGLKYPRFATGLGLAYLSSRVVYTLGYMTGDPRKRLRGNYGVAGLIVLLGTSITTAAQFVLETL